MDCIFCKILEGEIPSYKLYEDEDLLAFLDITQGTKGHTLLIPKKHIKNIYELDSETAAKMFKVVPMLAKALKEAFNPIGLNIVNNNDKPLQSVFHFHIHLIPRYEEDGMILSTINHYGEYDTAYFKDLVETIKDKIKSAN